VIRLPCEKSAKQLTLSYIANNFDALCEEAKNTHMTYSDFLIEIFSREIESRRQNRTVRKLRQAGFPMKKYLQGLELSEYEPDICSKIEELSTLQFIHDKENLVCIGNPGRGKTHLAIALGIAACMADMRVLFTNVPNLVIELKEAMSKNEVTAYKKKFVKYELVIVDELGYVSFDKQGNEILFNLLSNRNESGSLIITTNLAFERWEEVFKDANLTAALVDRLTHKAHILDMSGESYRLKETRLLLEK
jgi:DNA replication protein DnaC